MIGLDIPMPKNCMDCPCSYPVWTGEHMGEAICEALEKKYPHRGFTCYQIDVYAPDRPEKCIMCELREE